MTSRVTRPIGIGGVVGAALLLGFGRRVSVPTATGVQAGLDRVGLFAVGVEPRRPDRSLVPAGPLPSRRCSR